MSARIHHFFFFSSRRRHTRLQGDWSSDVCSSDLERVELGSFGQIETDGAIAMRVRIPEQAVGEPDRLPGLRWRGVALDTYDGRAWSVARRERSELWRSPTGEFELGRFQAMGPVLIQEVYLEPFGTDILFAAPRLLHLSVRANAIVVDDAGGVSVQNAAARFR